MNLRTKINNRTTATVQMISDTSCIYSDEVSDDSTNCLFVIEGEDLDDLKSKIRTIAREKATGTRFTPRINFIVDGVCSVFVVEPTPEATL